MFAIFDPLKPVWLDILELHSEDAPGRDSVPIEDIPGCYEIPKDLRLGNAILMCELGEIETWIVEGR